MNSKTWKALAAAVVAAAGAATASAQNSMLLGNIPFAFSVGNGVHLGPGDYAISRTGNLWLIRDQETGRAVTVTNTVAHQGRDTEKPALLFDCLADHCRLRSIHAGGNGLGVDVPRPKMTKAEAENVAELVIPLAPAAGE